MADDADPRQIACDTLNNVAADHPALENLIFGHILAVLVEHSLYDPALEPGGRALFVTTLNRWLRELGRERGDSGCWQLVRTSGETDAPPSALH